MLSYLKRKFKPLTNSSQDREAACEMFKSMLREKQGEFKQIKEEIKALDKQKKALLAELEGSSSHSSMSGGGCTSAEEKELEYSILSINDKLEALQKLTANKKKEIEDLKRKKENAKNQFEKNKAWEKRREEERERQKVELEKRTIEQQEIDTRTAALMEELRLKQNILHGPQLNDKEKEKLKKNTIDLEDEIRNIDPLGEEGQFHFMGGKSKRKKLKLRQSKRNRKTVRVNVASHLKRKT